VTSRLDYYEQHEIEGAFNSLGDGRSRIAYSKDYEPADIKAWLVGRGARVSIYKGDFDILSRIGWIDYMFKRRVDIQAR
jgi:hypothetical protein